MAHVIARLLDDLSPRLQATCAHLADVALSPLGGVLLQAIGQWWAARS